MKVIIILPIPLELQGNSRKFKSRRLYLSNTNRRNRIVVTRVNERI